VTKPVLIIALLLYGIVSGQAQTGPPPQGTTVPPVGNVQLGDCLESTCRNAPVRENLSAIDLHVKYIRGILGGFRQGAGFGGGVQLTTANAIRHVELRATALTSTRLYQRYEVEAFAHDILDSRNHADVWFTYLYRREDNFFGIGPRIPPIETNFALQQRSYQGTFSRDFTDHIVAGLYGQIANARAFRGKDDKDPPIDVIFSPVPVPSPVLWLPGLDLHAKILSYGGFFEYDARDNSIGLTRGANVYGRLGSADGLKNHNAFADFGWIEAEVDGRLYIPLGSNKTSLALRTRGSFKDPKAGSQIPFYALSWLGGHEYVRGYRTYRFRGNNSLLFSAELRQTVYSKTDQRGVDVVGFADTGQVWGDARSQTNPIILKNDEFSNSNWHSGVGGGIQYRHSKSVAVRLEAGRSNERTLVYLSLSRGF